MLKVKGKKLIFISLICPDGIKLIDVSKKDMSVWDDDVFTLNRLSLTQDNYIASGISTYVVKLKQNDMLKGKAKEDFIDWCLKNGYCKNPHVEYWYNITIDKGHLTSLIIDWFDLVGIFIYIDSIQSQDDRQWRFHIHRVLLENIREDEYCVNRKDATEKAIKKANEIYNTTNLQ